MKRLGGVVFLIGVFFVLVLAACGGPPEEQVAAAVQATLEAMPTPTQAETATPQPTQTPLPPTKTPIPPTATSRPTSTPKPAPTITPTPMPPLFDGVEPLGCKQDEFQEINWCSKYNTPELEPLVIKPGGDIDVAVYVGDGGGSPFMRWDIAYLGEDWVFIDAVVIIVDGEKYTLKVDSYEDVKTDVYGGSVAEIYDRKIADRKLPLAIAFADEVKVRVSGKGGNIDKTLTAREKEIVKRALKTFEDKGGTFLPADVVAAGVFKE